MVTVGTRNVSAANWAVDWSPSAPRPATRISRLPFFNSGEGMEIVGRRLFGIDSETSP